MKVKIQRTPKDKAYNKLTGRYHVTTSVYDEEEPDRTGASGDGISEDYNFATKLSLEDLHHKLETHVVEELTFSAHAKDKIAKVWNKCGFQREP